MALGWVQSSRKARTPTAKESITNGRSRFDSGLNHFGKQADYTEPCTTHGWQDATTQDARTLRAMQDARQRRRIARGKGYHADEQEVSRHLFGKDFQMLLLERQTNETIVVDLRRWGLGLVEVMNTRVSGDKCYLGINADKQIPVHRRETFDRIEREKGVTP